MARKDLTIDDFETYLTQHPEEKFHRNSSCCCPIAKWLKHKLDTKVIHVGIDRYVPNGATEEPLPRWAELFIDYFDNPWSVQIDFSVNPSHAHAVDCQRRVKSEIQRRGH